MYLHNDICPHLLRLTTFCWCAGYSSCLSTMCAYSLVCCRTWKTAWADNNHIVNQKYPEALWLWKERNIFWNWRSLTINRRMADRKKEAQSNMSRDLLFCYTAYRSIYKSAYTHFTRTSLKSAYTHFSTCSQLTLAKGYAHHHHNNYRWIVVKYC